MSEFRQYQSLSALWVVRESQLLQRIESFLYCSTMFRDTDDHRSHDHRSHASCFTKDLRGPVGKKWNQARTSVQTRVCGVWPLKVARVEGVTDSLPAGLAGLNSGT